MNTKHQKFFACSHCGNVVGLIEDAGVPLSCCGKHMTELTASADAGAEKHTPQVAVAGQMVTVSAPHPMQPEHAVQWIYLQTSEGGHRKCPASEPPTVQFCLSPEEQPIAAFAYCNRHGLWETHLG